ncbi:MAG TPA: Dabb family protein [Verrucomicrobiae bacterium]|nr:Dabb family protein [Verrucomicrobiae bacterium]
MAKAATPVQHLVLFRFPVRLGAVEVAQMRQQIAAWIGTIDGLRRVRFGADVSGRSLGHELGLMIEFDGAEQLAAYLPHPLHQQFATWVAERGGVVLAFDLPLTPDTVLLEPAGI